MIEVELPDGTILDVDTDDPEVAAQAARNYLSQQSPGPASDALAPDPASLASQATGAEQITNDPLAGAGQNLQRFIGSLANIGEDIGDAVTGTVRLGAIRGALAVGDTDRASELASQNPFQSQGFLADLSDQAFSAANEGPQFQSTSTVGEALRDPRRLPRFIAENAIASAPTGLALAVPGVGAPAVAAASTDQIAEERARRDGRDGATASDTLAAAPAALASVALGRFGVRGANVRGATGNLGRLGQSTAREAGTEAAQAVIEEAGSGLGTDEGFSLSQAAQNALTGAVVGAGVGGGVQGLRQGQDLARARSDDRRFGAVDTSRLRAKGQAADLIEADRGRRATDDLPDRRTDVNIAGDLAKDMTNQVKQTIDQVTTNKATRTELRTIASRARMRNSNFGNPEIERINNLGLEQTDADTLSQALLIVDELSRGGVARNATSSPSEATGRQAGRALGFAGGLATGVSTGPLAPLAALATQEAGARAGGAVARGIDRAIGRAAPDVITRRAQIARVLERRGEEPTNNVRSRLADVRVRSEEQRTRAKKAAAANRLERQANDPFGLKLLAGTLSTDNSPSFDARIMMTLNRMVRRATRQNPEDIGINIGPGNAESPGFVAALDRAFADGLVTQKDVSDFNQDPEALMEGKRGLEIVIPAIQEIYLRDLQEQGLLQGAQ